MAVAKHAEWKRAHAAGETHNGRLLARGGRHRLKQPDPAIEDWGDPEEWESWMPDSADMGD